jgi:hypothetical protein
MFTAHLTPAGEGAYDLTVGRDGYQPRHVTRLDVGPDPDQGVLFDAAGEALAKHGWRPAGGDPAFFWGSPDGNMFDGPWRSRVEQA